ncbi:MAG: hypothetical protein ACRDJC_17810 [Thermomicrobiales bacterium]
MNFSSFRSFVLFELTEDAMSLHLALVGGGLDPNLPFGKLN